MWMIFKGYPKLKCTVWFIVFMDLVLGKQELEVEPVDTSVVLGRPALLQCVVKNLQGEIQWTKDDFGLGTDKELRGFARYRMVAQNGNYSLNISSVLTEDEGVYQCQVRGVHGGDHLMSRKAKLTVLVPPRDEEESVSIEPTNGTEVNAMFESTVRVTCRALLTKPAAKVTWYKDEVAVVEDHIKTALSSRPNTLLQSVTSWYDIKPDKSYDGSVIACHVTHEAITAPIIRYVKLRVQYPPSVTVDVDTRQAKIGDDVKFTCKVEANPPEVKYRWEVNGITAVGAHSDTHIQHSVTHNDSKAVVSCIVANVVGTGRNEHVLNVEFGPVFRVEPMDVDSDKGSTITLKCDVDSSPPSHVTWTHEESQKVIGVGIELPIAVSEETEGVYHCRAAAAGFPEVSRSMEVFMRGSPKVAENQVYYGFIGDTVAMECVTRSIPRPLSVMWSRFGQEVSAQTSAKYWSENITTRDGMKSVLYIANAQADDFGPYNCTARNSYGAHAQVIELRRQPTLPLVTTLVSIIGGILFLVIVIIVIILFKKQGRGYTDSSLEKESVGSSIHSSAHDSVMKTDTRTGSDMSRSDDEQEFGPDDWETSDATSLSVRNGTATQDGHRYSSDYVFPHKNISGGEGGYIPYVDYKRDYNPPLPTRFSYNRNSVYSPVPLNNVDPRFSAAYGNPYLRCPANTKAQNILGSSPSSPVSLSGLGSASNLSQSNTRANNNLNNALAKKNISVAYSGQTRNNLRDSNVQSQYIMLSPQERGSTQNVQGTHI